MTQPNSNAAARDPDSGAVGLVDAPVAANANCGLRNPAEMTIRELFGALKPAQLWSIVVAIAGVLAGSFALGSKLSGGSVPTLPSAAPEAAKLMASRVAESRVARYIEGRLLDLGGKGRAPKPLAADAASRNVKQAVFQSIREMDGNADTLRGALGLLAKRRPTDFAPYTDDTVANYRHLLQLRYQWLSNAALPALARAEVESGVAQMEPSTTVALPEELAVVNGQLIEVVVSSGGRGALEDELALIRQRLDEP